VVAGAPVGVACSILTVNGMLLRYWISLSV
jgi:hypothetical protein